ncbi:oligosaccharyltransferase alpha subunit [Diplodia corticola]|uniref:Dolichyl-diphosphooligosaccharide--protein glycosyltransferase subunit 1 n=1 Tax=Diplodia corticola TaxID=236234 RepID=A0A1J9RAF0_9PEZI|nr:oligosaccharyltransferase alpha subunit [Diplodia corticola]OJD37146.1 oligosaccharyltransferase alpha subunit [Diplodia corticola]
MRSLPFVLGCLSALLAQSPLAAATDNTSDPLSSKQILQGAFKPPHVFKNVNLVRNVNLEKAYPRETINVVIENVDEKPQDEYYLPFEAGLISQIGGLEVRDKKDPAKPAFEVEVVEFDAYSPTEFYRVRLPEPLKPSEQQTLSISYSVVAALKPRPATIEQRDKQYVEYSFSAYVPSAYDTLKQKTKLKFSSTDVPDYTVLPAQNADNGDDPTKQGSSFTYGPYSDIPAGAQEPVSVRYEFTKPLNHVTRLERDVEVSHWGGNLATEERYWLTNRGASLKNHFSRVQWQMTVYANPPSSALSALKMSLQPGSVDAYFTDDIGNVSTSRFRATPRESNLEIRPRYPVFGGWKYSFKVGWNGDLKSYLRKLKVGDGYVLKVPFLEGPKNAEGIEYERVDLRVILPEGAKNVKFETDVPIISNETSLHRTFMDTIGRTTLHISALNLNDEFRGRELLITYDYPFIEGFRKPITITLGMFAVFAAVWVLGSIDTSIGAKQKVKA